MAFLKSNNNNIIDETESFTSLQKKNKANKSRRVSQKAEWISNKNDFLKIKFEQFAWLTEKLSLKSKDE